MNITPALWCPDDYAVEKKKEKEKKKCRTRKRKKCQKKKKCRSNKVSVNGIDIFLSEPHRPTVRPEMPTESRALGVASRLRTLLAGQSGQGMKWLLGVYTFGFNRRHKLFGHLFSFTCISQNAYLSDEAQSATM